MFPEVNFHFHVDWESVPVGFWHLVSGNEIIGKKREIKKYLPLFFCEEQSQRSSSPVCILVCAQASSQSLDYSYWKGSVIFFSKKYPPIPRPVINEMINLMLLIIFITLGESAR